MSLYKRNFIKEKINTILFEIISLKPHGFFSDKVLNNSSFLLHEQKKRNKENSPSAFFCLLQYFSPLNKKNSLRSNSFLFLTLQKALPLNGKKMRTDLDVFVGRGNETSLRSLE